MTDIDHSSRDRTQHQRSEPMMTHLHGERLNAWIGEAEKAALPGISRFATGLNADLAAVTAGLSLPFSSGPVEGNVNRIKMGRSTPTASVDQGSERRRDHRGALQPVEGDAAQV